MSLFDEYLNEMEFMTSPFQSIDFLQDYIEHDFSEPFIDGINNWDDFKICQNEFKSSDPTKDDQFRSILKKQIKKNLKDKIETKIGSKRSDEARILLI